MVTPFGCVDSNIQHGASAFRHIISTNAFPHEMQEGGDPIVHIEEVSMLIERTEERLPSGACALISVLHHSFAIIDTLFPFQLPTQGAVSEGIKLRMHAEQQEQGACEVQVNYISLL